MGQTGAVSSAWAEGSLVRASSGSFVVAALLLFRIDR